MDNVSRTSKGLKNVKVALCFYFFNLILQFYSRKIFLDYLGSEILGLNTTAQNLLSFLNLAELGIGNAIAYSLYKPLFEKNKKVINDIVSIQGWLYRKIACFIIITSCILMCFFPIIFAKAYVPLWYTCGSFLAFLISSLLGYFMNYRQIVLSADQKEYKITFSVESIKIIKIICQVVAIRFLWEGYAWWMVLEVIMAIVTSYVLNKAIKKEYPWLQPVLSKGKDLQKEYPEIIRKTKQLFFHRIGSFALRQTSPLIIYIYASLSLVALYGNYMLIVAGVTTLVGALLNSIGAGVGNLVASGDKKRIKSVFWELTVVRIWIASIVCFGIYTLGHSFITLWVGKEYVLPQATFVVLIITTYLSLTRTNDAFLAAYGLYQDIYAPLVEALLNIGLSFLLGYYFGLTGILSGVAISLLVIVVGWKPYFLYRYGFQQSIKEYTVKQLKYILLLVASFILMKWIKEFLFVSLDIQNYWEWLKFGSVMLTLYSILTFGLFYLTDQGIKNFVVRINKQFFDK